MTHLWIYIEIFGIYLKFLLNVWKKRGLSVLQQEVQEKGLLSSSFYKVVWSPWSSFWSWIEELKEVMESGRVMESLQYTTADHSRLLCGQQTFDRDSICICLAQATDKVLQISRLFCLSSDAWSFYLSCLHLIHTSAGNKLRKYFSHVHIIGLPNPLLFPSL